MSHTAATSAKPRIQVPDSLRDILLEFSISYLLEQPGDVVDYAVDFFTKLQDKRQAEMGRVREDELSGDSDVDADDEPMVPRFATRRKSVFAEAYNPENADTMESKVYPKSDQQRSRLLEAVKNILLFRELDSEQMTKVLDAMFEKVVSVDETVITQGENGDNFYVIVTGNYKAYVDGKHIHTYEGKGSFGELALLYDQPRAATITADTAGQLWAMDRSTFRKILLTSGYMKCQIYESLLNSVPMLAALKKSELMNLADALVSKPYTKGSRIIKQGDAADGMYFIEEGSVSIRLNQDDEEEVEISVLHKGAYFGELALVTHRPRAASVYAVTDIKIAFLEVEAFERLLGPCMDIMKRNIGDYETQMLRMFGSKSSVSDSL